MPLSNRLREIIILFFDTAVLGLCLAGAYNLRFEGFPSGDDWKPLTYLIIPVLWISNYLFDQYKLQRRSFAIFSLLAKAFSILTAFIAITLLSYLFFERSGFLGRGVLPIGLGFYFFAATVLSYVIYQTQGMFPGKNKVVFFLETNAAVERLQQDLNYIGLFDQVQFVCRDQSGGESLSSQLQNYLKELEEDSDSNTLVLDVNLIDHKLYDDLFHCRVHGAKIFTVAKFQEKFFVRIPMDQVDLQNLILSGNFKLTNDPSTLRYKRAMDLFFAIPLFLISLPIIFTFGLLVKLTSRGPAFFSQSRVGKNEKTFTIHKLRTMRSDAEKDGAQWASENDTRITFLGKILRKTRIDELPQIWNVITGDMSFIGPRPERPEFIKTLEEHIPYYGLRHLVQPGISGWAQVNYPYGASIEDSKEKLSYDLYYVKNYNILLDLYVYIKTVKIMLRFSGR